MSSNYLMLCLMLSLHIYVHICIKIQKYLHHSLPQMISQLHPYHLLIKSTVIVNVIIRYINIDANIMFTQTASVLHINNFSCQLQYQAVKTFMHMLLLLLVFCCSSRSMTPITETHHRHLSSAHFFAVSYPSHTLLIRCSLFLPLVCFPVILPSRTSRNNTSCRRTCLSHLRFR